MALLFFIVIEHCSCIVVRFLIAECHVVLACHKIMQLAIFDTVGETFSLLGWS